MSTPTKIAVMYTVALTDEQIVDLQAYGESMGHKIIKPMRWRVREILERYGTRIIDDSKGWASLTERERQRVKEGTGQ